MASRRRGKRDNSLVEIYDETVEFFRKNRYTTDPPEEYSTDKNTPIHVNSIPTTLQVEVTSEDSFVMAERVVHNLGMNPVVLNFASDRKPGGGVTRGARAQEEDLFRRSNYHQSLNVQNVDYPLKNKIVYSPDVYIARNVDYTWKSSFIKVSCIAAAAARRPSAHIDHDGKERYTDISVKYQIKRTVNKIFDVAISHGHDALILGAWGCGAFRGPRDDIVDIFSEVIHTKGKCFKYIGFPILIKDENDCIGVENFEAFKNLERLSEV